MYLEEKEVWCLYSGVGLDQDPLYEGSSLIGEDLGVKVPRS